MAVTMYLQAVVCIDHSSDGGTSKDEVYVKYSIDGGSYKKFPDSGYHSMNRNDYNPWTTNLKLTFNSNVEIQLYDEDDTSSDDLLGSHVYSAADAAYTESNLVMSADNGARYVLVTGPSVKP